jgi:hypothetical protein
VKWVLCFIGWVIAGCSCTLADDPHLRVQFRDREIEADGKARIFERTIEGRALIRAQDGGLLVEDNLSCFWPITSAQAPKVETLPTPFAWLNEEELTTALQREFGPSFEVVRTPHYLICTSAGRGYGEWCGGLFERLHAGFHRFWKERIPGLSPPERPLVAIAFGSGSEYQKYQATDASGQVALAQGYFNARTNRMVLFDQTGPDSGNRNRSSEEIQKQALRQPATIGTVIHEAVHQLSFNAGLQVRYADNPAWFSEGMAMYFEAPDLEARSGWRTIGQVHPGRLDRFRALTRTRPAEIRSLIATDDRFRDPQLAIDAYAEAWALHFYLIRTRKEQYNSYLSLLGAKRPLRWDTPEQRVSDFEKAFGELAEVEKEQAKFMSRLRGGR